MSSAKKTEAPKPKDLTPNVEAPKVEAEAPKAEKAKPVYPKCYRGINCKKCGSPIRTNGQGEIFCPQGEKSCPLI